MLPGTRWQVYPLSCARRERFSYGVSRSWWPSTYCRHTPGNCCMNFWISTNISHSEIRTSSTTRLKSKSSGRFRLSSKMSLLLRYPIGFDCMWPQFPPNVRAFDWTPVFETGIEELTTFLLLLLDRSEVSVLALDPFFALLFLRPLYSSSNRMRQLMVEVQNRR